MRSAVAQARGFVQPKSSSRRLASRSVTQIRPAVELTTIVYVWFLPTPGFTVMTSGASVKASIWSRPMKGSRVTTQ